MKKYISFCVLVTMSNNGFIHAGENQKTDAEYHQEAQQLIIKKLHTKLDECRKKGPVGLCWYLEKTLEETEAIKLEKLDEYEKRGEKIPVVGPDNRAVMLLNNPAPKIKKRADQLKQAAAKK
jgi:hypothetical protein